MWHDGLLYKLQSVSPVNHWLLVYRWYKALQAVVRCNGKFSEPFVVTKGTRQESILSPHLFSIFINKLLEELKKLNGGLCTLEMMGVLFSSDGYSNPHVNNRIMKCRRSFYSLSGCGMSFPESNVDIKNYIWDSVCVSTLKYCLETMYLSNTQIKKLESLQGTLLKSSPGLSVHSHHSKLIRALNVAPVDEIIKKTVCGLCNRIFMIDSPMRDLCSHFIARYIVSGKIWPKPLFSRILNIGVSPLLCTLNAKVYKLPKIFLTCGFEESLANILTDPTIQSKESVSHKLLRLLTRY